jgi:hypothetical protein
MVHRFQRKTNSYTDSVVNSARTSIASGHVEPFDRVNHRL